MSDRPPSGPEWLHEIKFDGYRVIAALAVRLWARTTSDYTNAFTRIRDAVAALPAEHALLDGEAILIRLDGSFDFEGLRSREGQVGAVLVAYDLLEHEGRDVRPEPLEERGSAWRGCYGPQEQAAARRHPNERGAQWRWRSDLQARVPLADQNHPKPIKFVWDRGTKTKDVKVDDQGSHYVITIGGGYPLPDKKPAPPKSD